MDIFECCQEVNDLILVGEAVSARHKLIVLLDNLGRAATYPPVLNHLIRDLGLYPYLQVDSAAWQEKFIVEAFKVDVGGSSATLHREQSYVLSRLLDGTDVAISAPTSFGKSFIVDAFIAAKQPTTVVILVPTIALMDETRRRIFSKFSSRYNIITAADMRLGIRNIFIFPQERVFGYIDKIDKIDLLIVDEFYKASRDHDKERSPSLLKAILKLSSKSIQRYYLAPNIKILGDSPFTKGMEFIELLDFGTVYLEKHELFREIGKDASLKGKYLLEILKQSRKKSLIYAGSYPQIDQVGNLLLADLPSADRPLLNHFSRWLAEHYDPDWQLTHLVKRGVGIHNGRMHRSLSQLQIRLFEAKAGFDSIVSTSSIIEGVNTSAENVIIWRNRLGNNKLKDFTYKNIIGRGGRMFKHFIGHIYLLEPPPDDQDTQLDIEFPETILGDLDEEQHRDVLDDWQVERIVEYKREMANIIGAEEMNRLQKGNVLQNSNSDFLLQLARDMRRDPTDWAGFGYLNSENPDEWTRHLYKIINLVPGGWDIRYGKLVYFIKVLSRNWRSTIPEMLEALDDSEIDVQKFFHLERNVTFKMSAMISDVNELHKIIVNNSVDVSPFISKIGHAFLPKIVYQLEEYGLPRMISRKIQYSGIIDLEDSSSDLRDVLDQFTVLGVHKVQRISSMTAFDRYIVRYFFKGITRLRSA